MPKLFNQSTPEAIAQEMIRPVIFAPSPNTSPRLLAMLEELPFFTQTLKTIKGAGAASISLVEKTGHNSSSILEATKPLPYIGLAFNGLDVIRIPMIYLAAFYLNEPVPFTLSNTTKWFYAAAFLSLGLTGILIPFTAPIIGVTLAATAFIANATVLQWSLKQYQKDKQLPETLRAEEDQLIALQNTAKILKKKLKENPKNINHNNEINQLKILFDAQKSTIQQLYDQQESLITSNKLIDKGVSISLSSVGLAGSVALLLAVPAAPFILISAGLAGGVYLLSKMALKIFLPEPSTPPQNKGAQTSEQIITSTKKITQKTKHKLEKHVEPEKTQKPQTEKETSGIIKTRPNAKHQDQEKETQTQFLRRK